MLELFLIVVVRVECVNFFWPLLQLTRPVLSAIVSQNNMISVCCYHSLLLTDKRLLGIIEYLFAALRNF